MKHYPTVLSISGSDSGGGSGIQSDLKTFSALGCYGTTAITAINAQNTLGINGIFPVPHDFVIRQIMSVLTDIQVDAIKIGVLYSADIICEIKQILIERKIKNIVLDPVMKSPSGEQLLGDETIDVMVKELFPIATIITPNLEEAAILLKMDVIRKADMSVAAKELVYLGAPSVILKGGHLDSSNHVHEYADNTGNAFQMVTEKIPSRNIHGAGCAMSSAIASFLAKGLALPIAVRKAQTYVHEAISKGKDIKTGGGNGPINHFFDPEKLRGI